MASDLETFGEVAQALQGIRDQLSLHVKVFAASVVVGLGVIGFLYNKMDTVETAVTKNTVILERLEAQMNKVAADAGAIRESVQTVSAKPSQKSFPGYVGVSSEDATRDEVIKNLKAVEEGWIFIPAENIGEEMTSE
ncbi:MULTISPECIES: hypothetical protein [unclassified Roseovarius]|uniref:hypothetical protein n=1 Tax=unclassified Roseovarius TaxID=2614913 RepID=UPI00273DD1C7|nr:MULTISPECIES: hypothetical protein [unclassified Roseovarius]